MKKEKICVICLMLVGIVCFGIIVVVLMRDILPVILPFVVAWFAACSVSSPASRLESSTRVSAKFWRPTLAVGAVLLIFGGLSLIVWQLADLIGAVLSDIAEGGEIYTVLARFTEPRLFIFDNAIPESVAQSLSDGIRSFVGVLLEKIASGLGDAVAFIPKSVVFVLVTLIALVYFSVDIDRINNGIISIFPEDLRAKALRLKENFFTAIYKYVKSYLQIMLITFCIMLVGFLILGIKRAPIIAVIVAVLDLLPILGVGIILVPWSVCALALGKGSEGVGLLIIFASYTVIREMLEPKILGKSLDVHPALTFVSLYVGYSLFGAMGLLFFPIFVVLTCRLFKKDKTAEIG